ncbi:toxin ParE1/3/4 [Tahibacter aquaticus]|uniref:Toxin ParE1/3/4 n=1 Tax=Tahibacter aquaticus TaxID=520092 RepID=A0A4R6YJV1_9GAMM|nr:type II toxin-antitoxin system RelE/ParE family toxin [Tahibacter aquaticus]TDR37342.1 toxin ParE1/3/4 [Tahibacter aquaticus]
MAQVFYTVQADADLLDLWEYIAQDNPAAATAQLRQIAASCQTVADMPGISRARQEIRRGLRTWPIGSYLVLHRDVPGGIEVVRVIHGARDLDVLDFD